MDIVSTKEHPGPYDGLAKAAPDEPVFPLIASDPQFEPTILFWVDRTRKEAFKIEDDEKRRDKLIQCTEAEMLAFEGTRYRKGIPEEDTITTRRASYSGVSVAPDQASRTATIRVEAASHAHEADYFLQEAIDALGKLPGMDVDADILIRLQEAHSLVHALALEMQPKRER